MTKASIKYTEAVRWRYLKSPKREKGTILNEFTKVTGYHRKTAVRLLHQMNRPGSGKKRGRPRRYGGAVVELRFSEQTGRLLGANRPP